MIKILLLLSIGFSVDGQFDFNKASVMDEKDKPENYTGVVVEHYTDGRAKLWRQEVNGRAEGLWLEWYPDGTLRYRAWWENGLGNGKWEYFYPNGQLRSESFYIDDIAQGLYVSYHENGKLQNKSVYKNGQLDGITYEYDVNGIQISRKRFQKGTRIIDQPTLFEPGTIATSDANEWGITFAPDGNTAYFTRRKDDGSPQKIYTTKRNSEGLWSRAVVADFSTGRDEGPFISPDGKYFFMTSDRPIAGIAQSDVLDMNLWVMKQTDGGWSAPVALPNNINRTRSAQDQWPKHYEAGPTIDASGQLYYWTQGTSGQVANLYQTRMNGDDSFSDPSELTPPSHDKGFDSGPCITPDGQLLFFVTSNREDSYGREDLYYTRLINGQWSEAKSLGPIVNSSHNEAAPRFSPDGKYFFFTSDRGENFDSSGERIWSIYYMETKFLMID
ncbi:hypothetical protein [Portibacter marinus]|uniref:hypothetical protein n=1 Tax=Portibacter marinus TaxID=2898660 RepID=UPI001F43D15A|nr:hypothetical protein [Portibacter marinus]